MTIISVLDVLFMVCLCFYYGFFKECIFPPIISVFLSPILHYFITDTLIPKSIQSTFVYYGGAFVCVFTLFIISEIFHTKYSWKEYVVLFIIDIPISPALFIGYFIMYRIFMNLPL